MRAALLAVLLVACKGPAKHAADAGFTSSDSPGQADAPPAVDAPVDSATCGVCGPIAVTLYGEGGAFPQGRPIAGMDVYFIAPDHTFQKVTTGSDGKATAAETPDGTEVIVDFVYSSTSRYLDVYPDLQIGDSLVIGDPMLPVNTSAGADIYIDFPSFSDATIYDVYSSCAAGYTPTSAQTQIMHTTLPCAAYTAAGIVVSATDSQGNLGYTSLSNIDFSTQNGPGNHFVMPAFQAAGSTTTNLIHLPMISTNDEVQSWYTLGNDPNDLAHFGYTDLYNGSPGTSVTSSGPAVLFGNTTHTHAVVSMSGYAGLVYDASASQLLSTVTIDAAEMPHPVGRLSGTYTAATQTVSWSEDATIGQPATIVTVGVNWPAGNQTVAMGWRLPGGATSSKLPTLPSALFAIDYNPNEVSFGGIKMQSFLGETFRDAELYRTGTVPAWLTGP